MAVPLMLANLNYCYRALLQQPRAQQVIGELVCKGLADADEHEAHELC